MEAKFGRSTLIDTLFRVSYVFTVLCGIAALSFNSNSTSGANISAIFTLIFIILTVLLGNCCGRASADEKGVTVVYTIFGNKIKKNFIEYGKIESTECSVETAHSRIFGIYYLMIFKIKKKDGSETELLNKLDIESSFPAAEPVKYKEYISEQPLTKMCDFINEQIQTRV